MSAAWPPLARTGRARFGRSRRVRVVARALLASCALLGACAQTDVIAREAPLECLHAGDCAATASCAPAACPALDDAALTCASPAALSPASPLVQVGDGCAGTDAGAPVSRFALCSCTDLVSAHPVRVLARDGTTASEIASAGVVGALSASAEVEIAGSLQLSGELDLPDDRALRLGGSLLRTPNAACGCHDENLLDVAALVAAQRTDVATFEPVALEQVASDETLELACGRYRVARVAGPSDLRILARGRVALFVEGDLALDGGMEVVLEEGASFDLFVAGNVRVGAAWLLGGAAQAGRVGVYVGGGGTIDLAAEASIAGPLYAPRAELVTRGPLDVYGALFVRRAAPGAELRVHVGDRPERACVAR